MWQFSLSQNETVMCYHVESYFMKILSYKTMTHDHYHCKRIIHQGLAIWHVWDALPKLAKLT